MKRIFTNTKNFFLLINLSYIIEFFLFVIAGALFIFLITGCKRENTISQTVLRVVTTSEINTTSALAKCGGQIASDGGVCLGTNTTAKLRTLTSDQAAQIHGDSQHIWPYGIYLSLQDFLKL